MSLMHRAPPNVEALRERARRCVIDIGDDVRLAYAEARSGDDPETYEEYRVQQGDSFAHDAAMVLISHVIDSARVGSAINSMDWSFLPLHSSQHDLLTSDCPIVSNLGLELDTGFVLLPVSPRLLFAAVRNDELGARFVNLNKDRKLAATVNDRIARQAKVLVIGQGDSQRRFIDNRFLRT